MTSAVASQIQQLLNIGDTVALGKVLANIHLAAVVVDPAAPNMFAGTIEAFEDEALLVVPALQGIQGPRGSIQFALRFMNDNLADPSQLPSSSNPPELTNTTEDIGKYWIFKTIDGNGNVTGTTMYVWFGTEYRQFPVGTRGPAGPYPVITPIINVIPANQTSTVVIEGPVSNPQLTFNLALQPGPEGPTGSIGTCPDVDLSTPPTTGQVLGFTGSYTEGGQPLWKPMNIGEIMPRPYTIPESSFQSYNGITGARQTVCTWQAPIQKWSWKPLVWGQIEVFGVTISLNPMLVGVEVRMRNPNTGPLVARGIGNAYGSVTVVPHTSTPSQPNVAMTPDNTYAQVQAGEQVTFYVNLYNDGMVDLYDFTPTNAQLAILAVPNQIELATAGS